MRIRFYFELGLVAALAFMVFQWHQANVSLKQARLAYEHPKTEEKTKIVFREGPLRVRTVTVKEGTKETTEKIEERGSVSFELESSTRSTPISVGRSDPNRYLVGWQLDNFSRDYHDQRLLIGYGFSNRLDVLLGVGKPDRVETEALVVVRF